MKSALCSELPPMTGESAVRELDDFDALVGLYKPRIFRFILASLRDWDAAETLTQDSFIRAYRARDQFRGAASVQTWLMQIAVNVVRDHLRNSRLQFWRRALRTKVDVGDARDWLADRRQSPEELVVVKQKIEAVWNAATALPERQRTVFMLRFVEDMDLLEIAAVTGMKEGTVKAHLFRALQGVRAEAGGKL